jgi:hypothetical protein
MEEKDCKTNIEAVKNVLDSISKLIIAYNPGDVLTAAEIALLIRKETAACAGCEEAEKICVHMEALISAGSANNFELLTDEITEGIDLLVSVIEATEPISSGKKKQINDWIEKKSLRMPRAPFRQKKARCLFLRRKVLPKKTCRLQRILIS